MSQEKKIHVANGWVMLPVNIALVLTAVALFAAFIYSTVQVERTHELPNFYLLVASLLVGALGAFSSTGHFGLQPNQAQAQPVVNTGTLYA
jgi:hypothetical protein